jgi:hypothetical protein
MRRTTFILAVVIILIGCQQRHSSNDCITFIDSMKIILDNSEVQVSLIDLAQEQKIRPYTIIYGNHLIVLNKADSFYSFTTDCFERDTKFENKLNSQRFKKALVITDTLYGIDSVNQAFKFDKSNHNWIKRSEQLPLFNSEPICETDKYICYSICQGEYGGLVFFYNKITQKITFAPATCAVSLMKFKDGFYIISNLAHMQGSSDIVKIENPDLLYVLPDSLNMRNKWDFIINYYPILCDKTISKKQITPVFEDWEKLISSGFKIKGKNYFLTKMMYKEEWRTYLSRFENDSLRVINTSDTIFADLPASHGEITRKTNNQTVIDYTLFAEDSKDWIESEERNLLLTTFILTDSTLIRINWTN